MWQSRLRSLWSPTGLFGLFIALIKPLLLGVGVMGDLEFVSAHLDDIERFLSSGWGTLTTVALGALIVAYSVWKTPKAILPKKPDVPTEITDLAECEEIIGKTYADTTVRIDRRIFRGCHFINCRVRYNGDMFVLDEKCTFKSCAFETQSESIAAAIKILRHAGMLEKQFAQSFQTLPDTHFQFHAEE